MELLYIKIGVDVGSFFCMSGAYNVDFFIDIYDDQTHLIIVVSFRLP